MKLRPISRRSLMTGAARFAGGAALAAAGSRLAFGQSGPAIVTSDAMRPQAGQGLQVGDVGDGRAIVWCRADRPSRMAVEYATSESFADARRVIGPHAIEAGDFTARVDLAGLPAGQDIFYRVRLLDLGDLKTWSAPLAGRFRTPPAATRDLTILWSGDTAGQGWGIGCRPTGECVSLLIACAAFYRVPENLAPRTRWRSSNPPAISSACCARAGFP